jgi:hypothetical protein
MAAICSILLAGFARRLCLDGDILYVSVDHKNVRVFDLNEFKELDPITELGSSSIGGMRDFCLVRGLIQILCCFEWHFGLYCGLFFSVL